MSEPTQPEASKPAEKSRQTSEADLNKYKVNYRLSRGLKKPASDVTTQTAGDIVNDVMKQLVELCVDGAKVLDLCIKGDELIEQATGAVYNKPVKGAKVGKGTN
jgi:hypothetical protein